MLSTVISMLETEFKSAAASLAAKTTLPMPCCCTPGVGVPVPSCWTQPNRNNDASSKPANTKFIFIRNPHTSIALKRTTADGFLMLAFNSALRLNKRWSLFAARASAKGNKKKEKEGMGQLAGNSDQHQRVRHYRACEHERNCVQHFDERIERRTTSVFHRVSHRVAHDCRFVRVASLAAVSTVFNELFRIISSSSTRSHENDQQKARGDCPCKKPSQRLRSEQESYCKRRKHCHCPGNHELLQCACRCNIDRYSVVGLLLSAHQSFHGAELPAHFLDYFESGFSDCFHQERREQERQQRADEQAYDDGGVEEVYR